MSIEVACTIRRQHEEIESLKRENEANERNLCTLTDDLAASRKEVAQLHEAIVKLRGALVYASTYIQEDAAKLDDLLGSPYLTWQIIRKALKDTEGLA